MLDRNWCFSFFQEVSYIQITIGIDILQLFFADNKMRYKY